MPKEDDVLQCESCGGQHFEPIFLMIWRSKLFHVELKKDGWAPVQTFRCADCHYINEDMRPLKTTDELVDIEV